MAQGGEQKSLRDNEVEEEDSLSDESEQSGRR
eukprot:CAMPEP_0116880062 /NCGR_PEP_ID=MMETSP0463-20121206/11931_1 /TAXON_ID=181622 /ORGANISM="Strombidinopsis sp, Strain SopsisLIS2011" /LENGTH=31 /DNA_ID= /DNA_START= /DNA_END= /DNA_ORIENTATION=